MADALQPSRDLWADLSAPEPLTTERADRIRKNLTELSILNKPNAVYASCRMALEIWDSNRLLIDVIKRFDDASANLIRTTNRLTTWILVLTLLTLGLGVIAVWKH